MARNDDWCVLRTSASRTLPLAASLASAGFDVWTPVGPAQKRKGPARARVEVDAPIMPTFVFAPARRLAELLALSASLVSRHPSFSVFRYCNRIPLLADSEIDALRSAEGRAKLAKRKDERHTFEPGQKVSVPEGAFSGLSGVVEEQINGEYALVCFGEWRIKVATFLLREDSVRDEQLTGAAA